MQCRAIQRVLSGSHIQEGMDLHSHRDLEPLESQLCYLLVLSLPMVGQTHHGVMEEPVRGPCMKARCHHAWHTEVIPASSLQRQGPSTEIHESTSSKGILKP